MCACFLIFIDCYRCLMFVAVLSFLSGYISVLCSLLRLYRYVSNVFLGVDNCTVEIDVTVRGKGMFGV